MPTLQDYIKMRDWIGAVALLESERTVNIQVENSLWLAYCYFHMGEYRYRIYDLGNLSTSMMNSYEKQMIKTIISIKPVVTMRFAYMMTQGEKLWREPRLLYKPGFFSTSLIKKMIKKTWCNITKNLMKVLRISLLWLQSTICEAITKKQPKFIKNYC